MNLRLMALNIQKFVPGLSLPVIKQRINIRYKQVLGVEDWEFLKASTTVWLKGMHSSVDGETVAINQNTVAVNGTGTTFTSNAAIGYKIRFNSESQPYAVSTVASNILLTIGTSYGGTTQTAASYDVYKTIYSPDVGDVGEITSIVYDSPLVEVTESFLNKLDPNRSSTGEPRYYRIYSKTKASGTVSFEIWPIPDQDYVVTVFYKKVVSDLTYDTDEPIFNPELLEAGSLYDCYRLAFATNNNTAYIGLARDAKTDYATVLREAIIEDINTSSISTVVKNVTEPRTYDDQFRVSHDVDPII